MTNHSKNQNLDLLTLKESAGYMRVAPMTITDKSSFISKIEKQDHSQIVYYANEKSYELIFKRLLPFVDKLNRKLSYANVHNFNLEWYIDTNDLKFINILKKAL